MKTKLALFLALCLPAFGQFSFFTALSTWKGSVAPYVGPFDSYTASQGLWDINVRLLSAYTGNLITVRRSSDNATNSFTYVSGTGKLDTNAVLAWSGSDTVYITTVYDQSGGGRNFSQSDTNYQPKLINAGTFYSINGEPSMQKTATGVRLYAPITGTITNFNIIVVGKSTDATNTIGPLMTAGDNTGLVQHTVTGPNVVTPYDWWVYVLGMTPVLLGDAANYPYPHTFSISVDYSTTNLVFNMDTIASANDNGRILVPWTTISWLDDYTATSSAAAWASGSMAFFSSIPSDQTTIMRYYTNRFSTTYIPATTPAPLALSVTALQYLRADTLAANGGADGSNVTNWTSDAGPTPTQASPAAQPTLHLNAYATTHACVRFTASQLMDHSSVASLGCWMVINGTTWNSIVSYVTGGSAQGYYTDIPFFSSGPGAYDGASELGANGSNLIATGSLHSLLIAGNQIWIDGAQVTGYRVSATLGTVTVTRINDRTDVSTFSSAFDLVEIAHFNGVPTAWDRSLLFAWGQTLGAP